MAPSLKKEDIYNMKKIFVIALLFLFIAANALAITITVSRSYKVDREGVREGTIAFDSSYPTGGESIAASDFKLRTIRWVELQNKVDVSGNLKIFEWDATASTIKVYDASSNISQVGSGESLSTLTGVKFKVFGY